MPQFVFLQKGTLIVPQSLDETEAGLILSALLQQQFVLQPASVHAESARQAMHWWHGLGDKALQQVEQALLRRESD